MTIIKITSVLLVEDIHQESILWTNLGFKVEAQVPFGDTIGFMILSNGISEIMLQTPASLKDDLPAVAHYLNAQTHYLFTRVDDLADIKKKYKESDILVPERHTFYGTKEFFIKTPAGQVMGFAQKV